jgi:outer membrane lipoprotein SlyB
MLSAKKMAVAMMMAVMTGCASLESRDYSYEHGRTAMQVVYGVVRDVRPVNIQGHNSWVGPTVGGTIGGVGAGVGTNNGWYAAAASAVGAMVGAGVEKLATKSKGLEITVTLDSGQTISIVQGDGETFSKGDRVKCIQYGKEVRVTKSS